MLVWGGMGQGSAGGDPALQPQPQARGPGRGRHSRQRAGASSLPSRQSLSPSHFQRSWMQRLLEQANSPGWHWGGGT